MPKNFAFIRVVPVKSWGKGVSRAKSRTGRGWGVTGCAAHDLRFIDTPNADPKLLSKNAIVTAKTNWRPMAASKDNLASIGITGPEYLAEWAKEMIAEKGIKLQKNHVKMSMLMCAVSPEFLRDGENGELNDAKVSLWKEGTMKYLREKYGDNLLSIVFHYDETNPHASAYLLPIRKKEIKVMGPPRKGMANQPRETTKEWRMCHRDFFNADRKIYEIDAVGKKVAVGVDLGTCSKMQDEYALALQEMGLDVQRGIRKAKEKRALEYQTIKEIYNRKLAEFSIDEIKALRDDELRQWLLEKAPILEEVRRVRIERDHYQSAAGEAQKISEAAQKKANDFEKNIADSKRDLPVADVIKKLVGLDPRNPDEGGPDGPNGPDGSQKSGTPKKKSSHQMEFFMPNGMRIGVTNQNGFENLTPEIPFEGKNVNRFRGKGALDAVIFITGWDFKAACEWIADNFTLEEAGRVIARRQQDILGVDPQNDERLLRKNYVEKVTRDLETPDGLQWEAGEKLLLKTFKFREQVIEDLHESNWIDTNKFGHLIFQKGRWNEKKQVIATGKIIVDPRNPMVTLKETGDNGMFLDIDNKATKVIICSSPMEALSIRSTPDHYASTLVVIGNNPNEKTISALQYIIEKHRGPKILAEGFSAASRKLAAWMLEHFPAIETLPLPTGFENWLDYHKRPRYMPDPPDFRIVQEQNSNGLIDDIAME